MKHYSYASVQEAIVPKVRAAVHSKVGRSAIVDKQASDRNHIYWHSPTKRWRVSQRDGSSYVYHGSRDTVEQAELLAEQVGLRVPCSHAADGDSACQAVPRDCVAAALLHFRQLSAVYSTSHLPADFSDLLARTTSPIFEKAPAMLALAALLKYGPLRDGLERVAEVCKDSSGLRQASPDVLHKLMVTFVSQVAGVKLDLWRRNCGRGRVGRIHGLWAMQKIGFLRHMGQTRSLSGRGVAVAVEIDGSWWGVAEFDDALRTRLLGLRQLQVVIGVYMRCPSAA